MGCTARRTEREKRVEEQKKNNGTLGGEAEEREENINEGGSPAFLSKLPVCHLPSSFISSTRVLPSHPFSFMSSPSILSFLVPPRSSPALSIIFLFIPLFSTLSTFHLFPRCSIPSLSLLHSSLLTSQLYSPPFPHPPLSCPLMGHDFFVNRRMKTENILVEVI